MKAIVFREFGSPDVLRLEEVPTPRPGPGEVLVEVKAVSVNTTLDLIVRSGNYAHRPDLPHVLGVDPSGVISAVGPDVTSRKVGDRVYCHLVAGMAPGGKPLVLGVHTWGGYAEFVKTKAEATHLIPDSVDFTTATIVARHAPLAFTQLRDHGGLQPGQWVLVMGAAGGLGSAGVQVAKYLGGRVIAAAGSDERVRAALELGADEGVNYRASDLTAEVMRITNGAGVSVVLENIGDPELFPKALASLARKGRLVTAGAHGGGVVPLNVSHLYLNQLTIIGDPTNDPADIDNSLRAAAEQGYRVVIDRVLPLSKAAEAHRLAEARSGIGKIVLDPTQLG
jgi:NADPH:quinone reductase-like Zn-dependent oxidoreductase